MDTYTLVKEWKKRTRLDPIRESRKIRRQFLNEISYANYEKIKDWMSTADEEDFSFGHMFGDYDDWRQQGWRVAFPLTTKDQKTVASFMGVLTKEGWKPDFEPYKAMVKYRVGETGEEREREETRYHLNMKRESEYTIPKGPRAGEKTVKKERLKLSQALNKEARDGNITKDQLDKYQKLIDTKLEFYTKHPEELLDPPARSIVVSRHPIDILRMSDHTLIHSCHSEGASHFQCAMAEARGHGPVAMVVNTDDLKGVDLEADEIFEDPGRDVDGIEPVGRVRLRKYVNNDHDYELAIPEKRVYGELPPGFLESVRDWTLAAQKEYLDDKAPDIKLEEDENGEIEVIEGPDLYSFTRKGGSWKDNTAGVTFNRFFDTDVYFGDTNEDPDEEEADELEIAFNEMVEECRQIQQVSDTRLEHAHVQHDVDVDEQPYVTFGGGMTVELNNEDWVEDVPTDWSGVLQDADLNDKIRNAIDHITGHGDIQLEEVNLNYYDRPVEAYDPETHKPLGVRRKKTLHVRLYADASSFDGYDARSFDGFADAIENEWDDRYDEMRAAIRGVLVEEGYIRPSEFDKLKKDLTEADLEFKHFQWDYDDGELTVELRPPVTKDLIIGRFDWTGRTSVDFEDVFRVGPVGHVKGTPSGVRSQEFDYEVKQSLKDSFEKAKEYAGTQLSIPFPKEEDRLPEVLESFDISSFMHVYPFGLFSNPYDNNDREFKVKLNIVFLMKQVDTSDEDVHIALETIHYFDKKENLQEIAETAAIVLAQKLAKYETWRKKQDTDREARAQRRVGFIETLLDTVDKMTWEDVVKSKEAEHPRWQGSFEPAHLASGVANVLRTKLEQMKETSIALRSLLDRKVPMHTAAGPRAYGKTSWADIDSTTLNGNMVSTHLSSIKSTMRMMGMQKLVNKLNAMMDQPSEDPSSTTRHGTPLRGTFGDPVPAKRDEQVYRERALKLVREVLNI